MHVRHFLVFVILVRHAFLLFFNGIRQQRLDHYRYQSSSDDIQVIYESKNYVVVNKDDLVPIDAYDAPTQVNVT